MFTYLPVIILMDVFQVSIYLLCFFLHLVQNSTFGINGRRFYEMGSVWAPSNPPLSFHFSTSTVSFSIVYFFSIYPFSLSYSSILLLFHFFPFYQNSHHSVSRPQIVAGD